MTLEVSVSVYEKIKPYLDARNMLYVPKILRGEYHQPVVQLNFTSEVALEEQKSIEDIVSWLDASNPSLFYKKESSILVAQGG